VLVDLGTQGRRKNQKVFASHEGEEGGECASAMRGLDQEREG
jgi:hypothetical protein